MRILVLDGNENQAVAAVRSLARGGHRVEVGAMKTSGSKESKSARLILNCSLQFNLARRRLLPRRYFKRHAPDERLDFASSGVVFTTVEDGQRDAQLTRARACGTQRNAHGQTQIARRLRVRRNVARRT